MCLFLRKLKEETNHDLIASMTRRHLSAAEDSAKGPKFLATFAVEKMLPLMGRGKRKGRGRGEHRAAGGPAPG